MGYGLAAGGVRAAEETAMVLVAGLVLLALFSLISILLGSEDGGEKTDPYRSVATWVRYGLR